MIWFPGLALKGSTAPVEVSMAAMSLRAWPCTRSKLPAIHSVPPSGVSCIELMTPGSMPVESVIIGVKVESPTPVASLNRVTLKGEYGVLPSWVLARENFPPM